MHSVMPLQVPFDGWTVDDLPDDEYARLYELVDGALLVTPPPTCGTTKPRQRSACCSG